MQQTGTKGAHDPVQLGGKRDPLGNVQDNKT